MSLKQQLRDLRRRFLVEVARLRASHPQKNTPINLAAAQRIVVIRADGIGDYILMSPFFRELRRNAPQADITLVCMPECADLARLCPYINRVIPLPKSWRKLNPGKWRFFGECQRFAAEHLRPLNCDMAILPRFDADYYHATFLAAFSGAPIRVGYPANVTPTKKKMNPGYDRLLTHRVKPGAEPHELLRDLHLLRDIGGTVESDRLEFWHDPAALSHADTLLTGLPHPRLAVSFSATESKKLWPVERFAAICDRFLNATSGQVILMGPLDDADGAARLIALIPEALRYRVTSVVGQTSLAQAAAVLSKCDVLLANDSGPAHLAAAAGCGVVTVRCHFKDGDPASQYSPARFGPWTPRHIACMPEMATAPCVGECTSKAPHCILQVTVDQVWPAVQRLLPAAPTRTH